MTVEAPIAQKVDIQEEEEEAGDDSMTCNICFEPWSNTGTHRISSLKCGHFFGLACIEKWYLIVIFVCILYVLYRRIFEFRLSTTGANPDCPTCNEKAAKRDIRFHYISKLKAIDTGDRDRALEQVASLKKELRQTELENATLKMTVHLQKEELQRLKDRFGGHSDMPHSISNASSESSSGNDFRLVYVQRLNIIRAAAGNDPNKACRVMAYNEMLGMLVVSQPSFTALAPGFGFRRVNSKLPV